MPLIADIHANAPALEAVLEDIRSKGLSGRTYHLGDLVGYAPFPNETVSLLSRSGIPGVAGNYDTTVAMGHDHCGCEYQDPDQACLSQLSFEWTLAHTDPSTKEELERLPFRIDLRPDGGHKPGRKLVLVHGTPTLNTLYWHAERSDEFCDKMGRRAGAEPGDMVAFGHTHVAWYREVEGVHYVNAGSVGRPKDGDWRAGYAIVDMTGGGVETEFVRVSYDLERTCEAIRESSLPDFFADYLTAGGSL